MKTPITYYGGKQKLLKYILPLIPKHILYAEPFVGGGAVFFGKEPSEIEIINDTNKALIIFYKVAKSNFRKLNKRIQETLHSKISYKKAKLIYNNPEFFNEVDVAWALWMLASSSFASSLNTGMAYDKTRQKCTRKFGRKKRHFTKDIEKRLEHAHIESNDACNLIKSRDAKTSFFYCDPPYFNADQGHYKGYTEQDFERLLQTLSKVKGKFILSSYPSGLLEKYIKRYNWYTKTYKQHCPIGVFKRKLKTEVLTTNYLI